ncbi:MAG: outer membrane beta-barrel family protein [Ginsengibacter sp.]
MKHILLLFFTTLYLGNAYSQIEKEPLPTDERQLLKLNVGNQVFGKVLDVQTNKALGAASVQLWVQPNSEQGSGGNDSLMAAMLAKPNGDFAFENIPAGSKLKIVVSSVGYSAYEKTFSFSGTNDNKTSGSQMDLGNIIMAREAQKLEGITIVTERPAFKMGIDKKIFDVGKSLTSKGGTAVDVMKSIPTVSVDVDGNVELRNASPTIFIDGRPTILTLDQIASDDIERVELITNPSAKYDASSGAGIINIILKKNKRNGLNGLVSVSGGLPQMFRSNANLNLRQGKFNFFVSGNYSTSENDSKGTSDRENKQNGNTISFFNQNSTNTRGREFSSVRFGVDYFIDNRNTLTLSQSITNGDFKNTEKQNQDYLDNQKTLERYGERTSNGSFHFKRNSSQLYFTHKFPEQDKELSASVNLNYGDVTDNSNIVNTFYFPDGSLYDVPNVVRNGGANNNNQLTAKIDFVSPLGENRKIETGVRSYINNYESYFNSFSVNNNTETKLPLSNNYKYQEQVHAAYITYTGLLGSIGYQAGLRGEYSKFTGTLIDSAKNFGYEYPTAIDNIWDALFPSLYLSKKINESTEVQLNYSRRVRRPDFWQLNPFIDINDPLNIQQGNPELKPEFRNSYEFNYSKDFKNRSNFMASIYYRSNKGDITRYSDTLTAQQYEQLNNAAVDPNAILNTYINSESVNRIGLELTLQQKFTSNFDITPSLSFDYRKVKADVKGVNLSNEGFNWEIDVTANYKIESKNESSFFNKMSFQLNGNYESPRVLPQGKMLRRFGSDFAVSKDVFAKNRGTFTFSVNDIFDSQRYGVIYDTPNFYQETYRRRSVRSFRLTFSYKFGNSDFSLFKKKNGGDDHEGGREG